MVRTGVSLNSDDKEWLDRKAQQGNVSMTGIVRRAVKRTREENAAAPGSFETLLSKTAGVWRAGDGLQYQQKIREEGEGRQ